MSSSCSKKWQLSQDHLNKFHVYVLVLENTLLDTIEDLWVLVTNFLKVGLCHVSDSCVPLSDHGGCRDTVIDERNFSEDLSCAQKLLLVFPTFVKSFYSTQVFCLTQVLWRFLCIKITSAQVNSTEAFCDKKEMLVIGLFFKEQVIGTFECNLNLANDGF